MFTFFLIIACGVLGVIVYRQKERLATYRNLDLRAMECEQERDELKQKVAALAVENESLAPYRGIVNIDAKVREKLDLGQKRLDEIKEEIARAKERAAQDMEQAKLGAREVIAAANVESKRIVDLANAKAREIAGDAIDVRGNARRYQDIAKAMKNIVEGYGDEYIVPRHTLTDDLAEEFGHKEAGQDLKRIRTRIREMVREGRAAMCEYVEKERRQYAIDFVVDAFNGKVDSILTRVKRDNVGKLQQEIADAFALVNYNGRAFRNAAITEEYCAVRREELRLAAVIEELRFQMREEQRVERERLRDEEKAQREYARQIRESEKEEASVRKALEQARADAARAGEEQKAAYEARLAELSEKLQAAEEKNRRAVSMAQQTKKGNVYVISNVGAFGEDVYKIGLTRRLDPTERIDELGDASVPFAFDIHAIVSADDAPALEKNLHRRFLMSQMNKVNPRKEFFRVPLSQIREEIERLGIDAKWTMLAEAREYKESQAIDDELRNDPAKRETWLRRQEEMETRNRRFMFATADDEDDDVREAS